MTRLDVERVELRSFTEAVRSETARSLHLLGAIESTLSWLQNITDKLRADTQFAERTIAELESFADPIDPEGRLQSELESVQASVKELYEMLILKRQHGRDDNRLTQEDGIEEAYTTAIAQAADLHNSFNTLRWHLGEHDFDTTPHVSDPALIASSEDDIDALFAKILGQ